uniref:Uncharacterized protein n=1 Tax=Timema douglasi TaxID=61478 RepID=A0A7R8VN37_TIMDO|nr:unnamed protein product [Timema douglasi]
MENILWPCFGFYTGLTIHLCSGHPIDSHSIANYFRLLKLHCDIAKSPGQPWSFRAALQVADAGATAPESARRSVVMSPSTTRGMSHRSRAALPVPVTSLGLATPPRHMVGRLSMTRWAPSLISPRTLRPRVGLQLGSVNSGRDSIYRRDQTRRSKVSIFVSTDKKVQGLHICVCRLERLGKNILIQGNRTKRVDFKELDHPPVPLGVRTQVSVSIYHFYFHADADTFDPNATFLVPYLISVNIRIVRMGHGDVNHHRQSYEEPTLVPQSPVSVTWLRHEHTEHSVCFALVVTSRASRALCVFCSSGYVTSIQSTLCVSLRTSQWSPLEV